MKNQNWLIFSLLVIFGLMVFQTVPALGHGVGSEKLPPVQMGQKSVTVEVSSSQTNDTKQITIAFIDASNSITIHDTTFQITATKGEIKLFDESLKADDGVITIKLQDSDETKIEQTNDAGFLESLVGFKKNLVTAYGPDLNSGGLYKFHIKILTAENYSNQLDPPITFNSAISVPIQTDYPINDPNYGQKTIQMISYYDKIENFSYDSGVVKFSMPFSWNVNEINQTSAVHVEVINPKTLGDLMVSKFSLLLNGKEIADDALTIDDFTGDVRIIHIIISQKDLLALQQENKDKKQMNFVLTADHNRMPLETVTESGQFKIKLNYDPKELRSGGKTKLSFTILDVFLSEKPISVKYGLSVEQNGNAIFNDDGQSNNDGVFVTKEFTMPESITGPIDIKFENIDGKSLARASLPVVVNRQNSETIEIPDWIKNSAKWWAEDKITDNDFTKGLEYLINNEIISIPDTENENVDNSSEIPPWVKNNAKWWSDGQINEKTFVNSIQFLINKGIIVVK